MEADQAGDRQAKNEYQYGGHHGVGYHGYPGGSYYNRPRAQPWSLLP